jgi:hypothetical protein
MLGVVGAAGGRRFAYSGFGAFGGWVSFRSIVQPWNRVSEFFHDTLRASLSVVHCLARVTFSHLLRHDKTRT